MQRIFQWKFALIKARGTRSFGTTPRTLRATAKAIVSLKLGTTSCNDQCSHEGTARNLAVFRIYSDDGVSGTVPLERRPEGSQILKDAQQGKFNELLVYKLDRLGRETRLILNAVAELEKLGVARVSVGSGPMRATLGLIGRMARQLREEGSFSLMTDGAMTYADANRLFTR